MQRLRSVGRGPIIGGAALLVIVIVIAVAVALAVGGRQPEPTPTPSPTATAEPTPSPTPAPTPTEEPVARCPLTGLPLDDASTLERTALAVPIDNHPGARPARNLTRADLVVEAPVEGDTTRFTAIFGCQPTEGLTGPIRSGRYYMVDLWQDLHVLPFFFGASNGALDRFADAGMPYVNGITGAWQWFRRFGGYVAPHNLYGDVEAARAAFGSNTSLDALAERVAALRPPFAFDPDAQLPPGRTIKVIVIRTNSYWRIGWSWDAALGAWRRSDGGAAVVDEINEEPITATHVLVQRVTQEVVYGDPDPGGNTRRLQHLVGEGKGTLYSDGRAIELRWSRPTAADGTHWTYAETGEPVVLPPGLIWWEIIPTTAGLTES